MSKAILVIDKPKSCKECLLFETIKVFGTSKDINAIVNYCLAYRGKKYLMVKENGVSEECPLRPLPKKQVEKKYDISSEYDQYYVDEHSTGWNDCIDEILKEEE